jgi:hypothetical protein
LGAKGPRKMKVIRSWSFVGIDPLGRSWNEFANSVQADVIEGRNVSRLQIGSHKQDHEFGEQAT